MRYLVGLLHPCVIDELEMAELRLPVAAGDGRDVRSVRRRHAASSSGTTTTLCEEEIRRLAPADVTGWRAFCDVKRRLRDALRPAGDGDLWIGRAPSRDELERRLGGDDEARKLLFEWSMVECVEHYLSDERLQSAYLGQGVIGTFASPHDPGTASIHFHHQSGRLGGMPGMWGYVKGGMGMVSFILCDIARDAGAVVLTGVPVGPDHPGRRRRAGGRRADRVAVRRLERRPARRPCGCWATQADPAWRARVEAIPQVGCTVKLNIVLKELPSFTARPGTSMPHHLGQINTPLTKDEWQAGYRGCPRRRAARPALDRALFPHGPRPERRAAGRPHDERFRPVRAAHVRPGRLGHAPRRGARTWRSGSIARYCDNMPEAVLDVQVLGPPDIEREVGLTGGHIFQGECLPPYMWDRRLDAAHADARRLPVRGLHPPRRQRDRDQRPQRRDGDPRRRPRTLRSHATARKYSRAVLEPSARSTTAPSPAGCCARVMSGLRRLGSSWGRSS